MSVFVSSTFQNELLWDSQLLWQQGRGQQTVAGAAEPGGVGPVGQDRSGAVTITVHAKPGSKHSSVTGPLHTVQKNQAPALLCCSWEFLPVPAVSTEAVEVAIAAPPVDGEANVELIRFLAEVLELKKSHIHLDKVFVKIHLFPNIPTVYGGYDAVSRCLQAFEDN